MGRESLSTSASIPGGLTFGWAPCRKRSRPAAGTSPGLMRLSTTSNGQRALVHGFELLRKEPGRVARLKAKGRHFAEAARAAGLDIGAGLGKAIAPVMTGSSLRAVTLSQRLFDRGVNVQPIIHPAIPERLARLRFFLSSEHSFDQIDTAIGCLAEQLRDAAATPLTASAPRTRAE